MSHRANEQVAERESGAGLASVARRTFLHVLGAGLVIAVYPAQASAQARAPGRRGGRGESRPVPIAARVHIGRDGSIAVMTGKVECGQGSRAEIAQAAAEELRVPADRIALVMADTQLVPDDGMTAGSRTSASTVPAVRKGAAAARQALVALAAARWQVQPDQIEAADGVLSHAPSKRQITYAVLAGDDAALKSFAQNAPADVTLTPVKQWKVLGTPVARPNARDLVTGRHQYPSDVARPGMLHGAVLRPPSYGATLTSLDLAAAQSMKGVKVVRDGSFVGVAAPTSFQARQALAALARSAQWDRPAHPSSEHLYDDLKRDARGGMPANPFADQLAKAAKVVRATYTIAYAQHAPLEPRAAVAEWEDDRLTVWTGTQNPFGVRSELARAFDRPAERVRVIVPDFGGGFGGKHSGEVAAEAARLARAAGRPVSLRWTRQEEFTWAYFRPAGVIDVEAGLDADGKLASWHFVNVNSGPSSIETPYRIASARGQFVPANAPLRQGSYRGLAATANTFARECAMDEAAAAAGADPLAFRLAHLEDARLRAVLEAAAKRFDWTARAARKAPKAGVGLACGTEKGSYVAACAAVEVDPADGTIAVRHVAAAFECGAILNPGNLLAQVQGAITMGLGPALREEVRFARGVVTTASFADYPVPRMSDLPTLDVQLLDRPDLPSAGAGETPIIAIAPAIANAVSRATAARVRSMPIRLPGPAKA